MEKLGLLIANEIIVTNVINGVSNGVFCRKKNKYVYDSTEMEDIYCYKIHRQDITLSIVLCVTTTAIMFLGLWRSCNESNYIPGYSVNNIDTLMQGDTGLTWCKTKSKW